MKTSKSLQEKEELMKGFTVKLENRRGESNGTGFILSKEGYIATCSHVIQSEEDQNSLKRPPKQVRIVFEATKKEAFAEVIKEYWRPIKDGDIAILKLTKPLPEGVQVAPLSVISESIGHPFRVFGYPAKKDCPSPPGLIGKGSEIHTRMDNAQFKAVAIHQLDIISSSIANGHSGSAIFDLETECVVGMISAIDPGNEQGRLQEIAYGIEIDEIVKICPKLKVLLKELASEKVPLSLRDRISDENLKSELNNIWNTVQELQGTAHCRQVEQNINRLFKDLDKFDDLEVFYLSAAAAIHDVGKVDVGVIKPEKPEMPNDTKPKDRDTNGVKKLPDYLRISPEHVSTLQKIVDFDSTKNMSELCADGYPKIFRLAVLFLLADTLVIKYSWEISDNNEILINANPREKTEVSFIENYVKRLNVDLYSSYPYLKKYNLPMKLVPNISKAIIASDPEKLAEETKGKTVAEIENKIKDLAETTEPIGFKIEQAKDLGKIFKALATSWPTILVVGDVMLDHLMIGFTTPFLQSNQQNVREDYSLCATDDSQPEEVKRLGGAANIAYCCTELATVTLLGVVGKDSEGSALADKAKKEKIDCHLYELENYITATKIYLHCDAVGTEIPTKIIRINRELNEAIGTRVLNEKTKDIGNLFRSLFNDEINCLILKDHQKGFLSKEFLMEISHDVNARLHNDEDFLLIVDPKYDWEKFNVFDKIHAIIPDAKEAAAGIFPTGVSGKEDREKAIRIRAENSRLQPGDLNYLAQTYQNIDCFIVKEDKNGAVILNRPEDKQSSSNSVYYDPAFTKVDESEVGQIGCGDVFDTYIVRCLLKKKEFRQMSNSFILFLHLANIAAGIKLACPTSEKVSIDRMYQELDRKYHINKL